MYRILFVILTLALSAGSQAEIYQSKDEQGRPIFSDRPSVDAEAIKLNPTNTTPAVRTERKVTRQSLTLNVRYQLTVLSPTEGSFFPNGLQGTSVSVEVSPSLQFGHQLQILHNGKPVCTGRSSSCSIERLFPGSNSFSAQVVDDDGKVLGSAASISVSARWPQRNKGRP